MNILQLATHLDIGGIASYIVSVSARLKRKNHKIIVFSSGGRMADELRREGIAHETIGIKTKSELDPKILFAVPRLLAAIKKHNIEIIHAHTRVTQVLACIASRLSGVPYVATCHGFFKKRLGRRFFKCWGKRTIAISDAVKRHLVEDFGVTEGAIDLIYNGVDIKRFRKEFSKEEKKAFKEALGIKTQTVIGAVGRLSPVKGYGFLLEAFRLLSDKHKDTALLIVGDGPEEEALKAKAKRLGIKDSVIFAKPTLDTPEVLAITDVFVSSAVQEGLGLSLVEALAAGKAVVATDVGGVSSVVKDKETGFLTKANDKEAFAQAISSLITDPPLRERLGENGRRFAGDRFDINIMAAEIEKTYMKALKGADKARRILIINVNWLGDVLFTTPFIKAVRKKYPSSYIACMAEPRCRELLEDNPNIDKVIIYDEGAKHKSIFGKLRLILSVRQKKFDMAFVLHRSFTKALIAYLGGIKERIGYDTKNRAFVLTRAIEERPTGMHKVEYFLNIARECGMETDDKDYEFFLKDSDRKTMQDFLDRKGVGRGDLLAVLNPGGNWPPKRWPKENFAALAERLSDELGARVVITGAPSDARLAQDILRLSKAGLIDASGTTSLKTLGALFERADLVISSDTGPMHLALSVGAKVIALFGPTSDAVTGPYGKKRYEVIKKDVGCEVPCYNFACSDYRCMKAITIEEVFEKAKEMLRKNQKL